MGEKGHMKMDGSTLRGTFTEFEVWQEDEDGGTHLRVSARFLETAQAAARDWSKDGFPAYIRLNTPIQVVGDF